ncbi:hypothetical protein L1278_003195 [Pontibacter sp. HSC-36F09]|nr:hypothetical protein [Pontibacter sp. HSC-36F09]
MKKLLLLIFSLFLLSAPASAQVIEELDEMPPQQQ